MRAPVGKKPLRCKLGFHWWMGEDTRWKLSDDGMTWRGQTHKVCWYCDARRPGFVGRYPMSDFTPPGSGFALRGWLLIWGGLVGRLLS